MQLQNIVSDNRSIGRGLELGIASKNAAAPILIQYWQVVQRWRWIIVGLIVSSLVIGIVLTLLATPRYTSTARIEISRDQKKVTNVQGVEPGDANRDIEFYQTQYSLLESRTLAERVVSQLQLADRPDFFNAHNAKMNQDEGFISVASQGGSSSRERVKRIERAVRLVQRNISISPIRGSALIDVSYTSASPEFSAVVANTWVRQFVATSLDRRFASTTDARNYLEGQLALLRGRVETSERQAVNFAAEKGIVALERNTDAEGKTTASRTLVTDNIIALNDALAKATAERISAQSRATGNNGGGVSAESLNNLAITGLRQKRAEAAAEYARLMTQFEPGYPAALAVAEQIRALDSSITREERRVDATRSREYSEAVDRERELSGRVQLLRRELNQQQRDTITYSMFQRDADTNRQLYDSLLQRFKEIGVAGVGTNNISVVDVAKAANKPSSPNVPLNIVLSLIAGLALAGVATVALDQIDESIREPGQVKRLLDIPLLGSVPEQVGDALEALGDPKSALSEAYLSLRSSLAFSTDHGVPRVLMVTSTRPGEGKSTTSFATALVLGRTGKRTLLIDGDMRSPSVQQFCGVSNTQGLSNLLAGDNDWKGVVVDLPDHKNVSALVAGPRPPSAAELLSTDRLSILVKELLQSFDHIVIDAPPILGLADAPLIARAAEGCIFVIEAGTVAVRGARASLARLHDAQAPILGAVLTKLGTKQAGYGYGYSYGYGYGASEPIEPS